MAEARLSCGPSSPYHKSISIFAAFPYSDVFRAIFLSDAYLPYFDSWTSNRGIDEAGASRIPHRNMLTHLHNFKDIFLIIVNK